MAIRLNMFFFAVIIMIALIHLGSTGLIPFDQGSLILQMVLTPCAIFGLSGRKNLILIRELNQQNRKILKSNSVAFIFVSLVSVLYVLIQALQVSSRHEGVSVLVLSYVVSNLLISAACYFMFFYVKQQESRDLEKAIVVFS